ncbi:Periplasmic thiol:disulfide interchange protein DsbA [hydrothermal vent metagenome]|uniref:Periplasmic thiol:disulfide interchange protein DsbA n=1 Tax=hydrothermal vent metagenome TaxID=652676 RepID=A0A3B0TQ58_9ZZZZ
MNITRRNMLILGAAASAGAISGLSPSFGAEGDVYDVALLMQPDGIADRAILGSHDAPVTIVEYAAPTCPHCAAFHTRTYPVFKRDYIETGKVRFILRPFLLNVLDAVVFMLAYTKKDDADYLKVIDVFFDRQAEWARSENPRDAILAVAKSLGFTEESFNNALTNQELFEGMKKLREQAVTEFGLTGTPTFYINGKMLSGDKSIEQMAAAIDPLLG